MGQERIADDKKGKVRKPMHSEQSERQSVDSSMDLTGLARLQQRVGNRTVQRLLAQRSGDGGFELDDDTAGRINQERSGGQALDSSVQKQAGESMGYDFGGVRVHTSPEADNLSEGMGAKAFTTGQDVFFREGAYDPHSSGGQELISHELTHVVQQGTGAVGGGGKMKVNEPGDAYEKEADATARAVVDSGPSADSQGPASAQRAEEEAPVQLKPERGALQMQAEAEEEEEEPVQTKVTEAAVQRQAAEEEEEEPVQTKAAEAAAQRQAAEGAEEEEPVQAKAKEGALQLQADTAAEEEEETVQMQAAEEAEEEEETAQMQPAEEAEEEEAA